MRVRTTIALAAVVAIAAIAAALVLILLSIGGDDNDAGTVTSPSPTGTFGLSTGRPTPRPTSAQGGQEMALNVPEAGGIVALAPGNYRTSRFQPQARFAVGEGWSASEDRPRFARLFRGNDPEANCVCFINPDGVIGTSGQRQALPDSVDEMIDWLTSNPRLDTSNPSSLQVGELSGRQLDVEAAGGLDEVVYLAAGDREFKVKETERQHLTVLDYRGSPLIIAQSSPANEYTDFFPFVEEIVGGLTFD